MIEKLATMKPPSGRMQSQHQAQLLHIIRSEQLIDVVKVNVDGQLRTSAISWDDFWERVVNQKDVAIWNLLDYLKKTRQDYIASGFSLADAASYCHAYFHLLHEVLEVMSQGQCSKQLLQAVVGFECFSLRWPDQQAAAAASTINVRNPVYLLAKLRQPQAYDDPKFLPLVTLPSPEVPHRSGTNLFYHYRQIRLSSRDKISLLAYPTANLQARSDSFDCLQTVFAGLTFRKDPRPIPRARGIVDQAIVPFMRKFCTNEQANEFAGEHIRDIDYMQLIDLGGGSGALLCEITTQLANHPDACLSKTQFDWTVVDIKLRQSCLKNAVHRVRQYIRNAKGEVCDFREWIQKQVTTQARRPFTVVLLARLLNNLSEVTIQWTTNQTQIQQLAKGRLTDEAWTQQTFLPHVCLAGSLPETSQLIASNARVMLGKEKTFSQLSLSDYFRGLAILHEIPKGPEAGSRSVWFVSRKFNPNALLSDHGDSILTRLCKIASLIVIEDIDLNATAIIEHLRCHQLTELAASDATDRLHMQGSNLICVSTRQNADYLPGKKLW